MKTINLTIQILLLAILLGFAGCSGTRVSVLPVPGEVATDAPRETLVAGRALATTHCGACHRLISPDEHSARAWPHIVANMGRRTSLTPEQMAAVARYYEVAAGR